jgi:hypothetical protein
LRLGNTLKDTRNPLPIHPGDRRLPGHLYRKPCESSAIDDEQFTAAFVHQNVIGLDIAVKNPLLMCVRKDITNHEKLINEKATLLELIVDNYIGASEETVEFLDAVSQNLFTFHILRNNFR